MPESVLIPAPDRTNSRGYCWTKAQRSARARRPAGSNCECIVLPRKSACFLTERPSDHRLFGAFLFVSATPGAPHDSVPSPPRRDRIRTGRMSPGSSLLYPAESAGGGPDHRRAKARARWNSPGADIPSPTSADIHRCRLAEVSVEQVIDERPVLRARAGVGDAGHDDELLVDCRGRRLSLGLFGPGSALRSGAERF